MVFFVYFIYIHHVVLLIQKQIFRIFEYIPEQLSNAITVCLKGYEKQYTIKCF